MSNPTISVKRRSHDTAAASDLVSLARLEYWQSRRRTTSATPAASEGIIIVHTGVLPGRHASGMHGNIVGGGVAALYLDRAAMKFVASAGDPMAVAVVRLRELMHSSDVRDGYHSTPVNSDSVQAAVRFVLSNKLFGMPTPDVTATSVGNAQLEWHWGDENVEVQFWPDGEYAAIYTGQQPFADWDGPVGNIPDSLIAAICRASGLSLGSTQAAS